MKRPAFRLPAVRPLTLAVLLGSALPTAALHAQMAYTYWDGAGPDANLGTGTNWQGNAAPTNDDSANVVFTDQFFAAGGGDLNPNLEVNWFFNTLSFAGGSSFTLGSTNDRGLDLSSGLTQNSTAAQTVAVPTFLTDDQTWTFASGAGALNFTSNSASGQIINQGYTLSVNQEGNNTLNGSISGTGAFNPYGTGTLTLLGASTYTGETVVGGGTLDVGTGGSINGTSNLLVVGNGATMNLRGSSSVTTATSGTSFVSGQTTVASLNLGDSASLSTGTMVIGDAAKGVFTQSGGTFNTNGNNLGLGNSATGNGTYDLSGGSLSTGDIAVGLYGTGTFNQTGGNITTGTGDFYVGRNSGGTGTYNLSGGTLTTSILYVGGLSTGTITQTGGTANAAILAVGTNPGVTGTYNLGGGTLTVSQNSYVGNDGMGTVKQTAGSLTVNQLLIIGDGASATGTYTLGGTGSLSTGDAFIGAGGTGTFIQSGGTFTTNNNQLVLGASAGATGTYTLGGTGSLSTGNAFIGDSGTGTFTQNGGTFTTNNNQLVLSSRAGGTGTYTLGGTGSLSTGNAFIGAGGTGTFIQSGGTFTTNNNQLVLGAITGGTGTYTLGGTGSLSAGNAFIGDSGTGTFTQNGGTSNIGGLNLAYNSGSTGTYSLNGGTLTLQGIATNAGTSTFNFNGGLLQAAGSNPGFLLGLTTADVQAGGARIDSNGFSVTVAQNLVHDTTNGAPATDGGLTKLGAGTLTLTGANTYFGATVFNGGTLNVGSQAALGNTSVLSFTGGTLQYSAANQIDYSGYFSTAANQAYSIDTNGQNVTFASALTSSGGSLTKLGAGTLTLTGSNTYTGGTTVSAGRLTEINNGNALSTGLVNISAGATLELSSTGGGNVSQAADTFTGVGTLQKTGAGTLAFGGNGGTVNVALAAGGLLDVEAGTLKGSSSYQASYASNLGGLHIAAGATFDGVEGTIRVDALTGAGTLAGGYNNGAAGSTTLGVNNGSGTFAGVIQDSGDAGGTLNLTKVGTGTQTLTKASTYTGGTTVGGGTLLAANPIGSATGTGAVQVNNAGTLAGSGTVAGPVSVASGGTLSPGSSLSPGRLTLGNNLSLNAGSTLAINLGGTAAGNFGQVALNGTLILGGNLSVTVLNGFTLAVGQTFVILDNASNTARTSGSFADAPGGLYTDAAGDRFLVNYLANADGGLIPNDVTITAAGMVPEPSAWYPVAIGMGLLGLNLSRRATRRA